MAALRKDGQPSRAGGPRPKVREDDRRGLHAKETGTHIPTEFIRDKVREYATVLTNEKLCQILGISTDTLRKYYYEDLVNSRIEAEIELGMSLVKDGMSGNDRAREFWLRSKAGWRTNQGVELTGADGGPIDLRMLENLTDADLAALEKAATALAGMDHAEPDSGSGGFAGGEGAA